MESDARTLVWGLGMIALVGGGFRAALLFAAIHRHRAHPEGRARLLAWIFTAISASGLGAVIWASQ